MKSRTTIAVCLAATTALFLAAVGSTTNSKARNATEAELSIRVLDSDLEWARGSDILLEWGTHSVQDRADRKGRASGWSVPLDDVGVITLGQRHNDKGLLLGQTLTLPFPETQALEADAYLHNVLLTQPIATTVYLESGEGRVSVPYANGLSIAPVYDSESSAGYTEFKISPEVGLLPTGATVEGTQSFFDVAFPDPDYFAGVHIVSGEVSDLGPNGVVMQINLSSYALTAEPLVRGVVVSDDQSQPGSLFEVEPVFWDVGSGQLHVWVHGVVNEGHHLILLRKGPGASPQTVWLQGEPALFVAKRGEAQDDAPKGSEIAEAARNTGPTRSAKARAGSQPHEAEPEFAGYLEAASPATPEEDATPDCGSGGDVPDPTFVSCEGWGASVAPPGEPFEPECPTPQPFGEIGCDCSWQSTSGKYCGVQGNVNLISTSSWSISASASYQSGQYTYEVGTEFSGSETVSMGTDFEDGEYNLGQCAQIFAGVCVKEQMFCGYMHGYKWVWTEILPHKEKDPCSWQTCHPNKVVNEIKGFVQVCDIIPE